MAADLRSARIRVRALADALDRAVAASAGGEITLDSVKALFAQYEALRVSLTNEYRDLIRFDDIPWISQPQTYLVDIGVLRTMANTLRYCYDLLEAGESSTSPALSLTKQGMFVAGEPFDALLRVNALVSGARATIDVVDGYINAPQFFETLSSKQSGVGVRVLTHSVPPAVVAAARAFGKQFPTLELRTAPDFHDRYVVIDETDYYHFGASLKDLGKSGSMFSRIEEPLVVRRLKDEWNRVWQKALAVSL